MFRVFLLDTDFGSTSVATNGFEKRTHAESLTSPTFKSERKIRDFRSHHNRGPAQSHSSVEREKQSGISTTAMHTKIFRLPTSVTNERFDTYGIFKITKICPNNITVNQVSGTIACTKKKSQFIHKTN